MIYGVGEMYEDIQKMRDKLNIMLLEKPVNSNEVLKLSRELDVLILKFYTEQSFAAEYSGNNLKY